MKTAQYCLLVCTGCFVAGCDLGTYSSRYNDRVGKMTSMANTNKDMASEQISIKGIAKIRVPKVCNNPDSVSFGENDNFTKARIPGIEIDGFARSFMGDKEASDGKWYPFQVYFFYMPGKKLEEVKTSIKESVGAVLKQTRFSWDSIKVESYDGYQYSWATSSVGAGQPFLVFENGGERKVDLNGRLDFYVTANDQGVLAIAFRAPSSVFGLDDQPLIDGTLKSIQGFN